MKEIITIVILVISSTLSPKVAEETTGTLNRSHLASLQTQGLVFYELPFGVYLYNPP